MTATVEPETVAPTTSIEDITPALAEALLGANGRNRSLRRQLVETYAADMSKGAWQFTGEALKIAADGALLDGQHRLAAVVKSGVSVPMLVVRGLPSSAQEVMDSGAKRTSADALRLRNETNATVLSSVARMILSEGGKILVRPSTTDLINVVETDPNLRWVINNGIPNLGGLKRLTTATVIGYAYWRLHKVDSFACAEFFSRLDTLTNLDQGSPILALHRRLSAHVRVGDGAQARREALAYIFMSWNAWRRNETRSIVKLAYSQGAISVPEPI